MSCASRAWKRWKRSTASRNCFSVATGDKPANDWPVSTRRQPMPPCAEATRVYNQDKPEFSINSPGKGEYMSTVVSRQLLLAGGVAAALVWAAFVAEAAAQSTTIAPNLQSGPNGWQHPFGGEFRPVPGSALPISQDPSQPFLSPQQSWIIGDLANPNLKQWAKDLMKKDNEDILYHGKIQFTANSACLPAGVPVFDLLPGPHFVVQTPKQVIFMEEQGQQVRHVYLD